MNNKFWVTHEAIWQWFRDNYWQIASLVTQKSLFMVTQALFFIKIISMITILYKAIHSTTMYIFSGIYCSPYLSFILYPEVSELLIDLAAVCWSKWLLHTEIHSNSDMWRGWFIIPPGYRNSWRAGIYQEILWAVLNDLLWSIKVMQNHW